MKFWGSTAWLYKCLSPMKCVLKLFYVGHWSWSFLPPRVCPNTCYIVLFFVYWSSMALNAMGIPRPLCPLLIHCLWLLGSKLTWHSKIMSDTGIVLLFYLFKGPILSKFGLLGVRSCYVAFMLQSNVCYNPLWLFEFKVV